MYEACASRFWPHKGSGNVASMYRMAAPDIAFERRAARGCIVAVAIVHTNAGYGPDPSHTGTGTVVALFR